MRLTCVIGGRVRVALDWSRRALWAIAFFVWSDTPCRESLATVAAVFEGWRLSAGHGFVSISYENLIASFIHFFNARVNTATKQFKLKLIPIIKTEADKQTECIWTEYKAI